MKKYIGKITIGIALVVAIAISIFCITVFSADKNDEAGVTLTWSFTVTDDPNATEDNPIKGTAVITGASFVGDYTRELNIPETVEKDGKTYQVVEIKDGAFDEAKFFGPLTLPESLTKIGNNAFKGSQIYGEIVIPAKVTSIGTSAFENCKGITSVNLPQSLTTISKTAFKNCGALRTINTENVKVFGTECFSDCYALYNVTIGKKVISINGVKTTIGKATEIQDKAFYKCLSLDQTFDLSSVTTLGTAVFHDCERIEGFIMPNVSFDLAFFSGCTGVKHYEITGDASLYTSIDGVIFSKVDLTNSDTSDDDLKLLLYPANKSDETYYIPEGVKIIEKAAFAYSKNIRTIVFPESVEKLCPEVFKDSSIETSYIPDNVHFVSVDTFKGCKSLEWVIFGANITTVGVDSFRDANSNVKVIAKNAQFTKPDFVKEENFHSITTYECVDHYYGYLDKAATCTDFGYNQCIVCDRISYIKELGHSGPVIEKGSLSCDTDEYKKIDCLRCNQEITIVTAEKTGHNAVTQLKAATDTTPGYTINYCLTCQETYIDNYQRYTNKNACSSHSHFKTVVISEANCDTNGLSVTYCSDCGAFIKSSVTERIGCSFETTIVIESSCTVNGQINEKCTVCGKERITLKELAPHKHEWYTISSKQGFEYSSCKVCGFFESREVDYSVLQAVIAKIPKNYDKIFTTETAAIIRPIKESQGLNLTQEAVDYNVKTLRDALTNAEYNVTDIPVVFIEKSSALSREDYTDAVIYIAYLDENGKSAVEAIEYNATMKIRGNSTGNYSEKYPYNIKFSSKVDLFGMGAGKKYCLIANLFDQTLMRNALAIDFSQLIGIQFAPSYQFVEVYYNGRYDGLYMLTTPMDIDENRIDIDEENDFVAELEHKSDGEFYLTSPIFNIKSLVEDTKDLSGDAYSNMYSNYYMVDYAIKSGDWELIKQYVDIESVSKYYVIHEYLKDVDMCYDSTRFYFMDGKLYGGPVWDYDFSMGNLDLSSGQAGDDNSHDAYNNEGGHTSKTLGVENNSATGYWADCRWAGNKNIWFASLMQYSPDFQKEVKKVLVDHADDMRLMYEDKIISKRETLTNKIDVHYKDEAFTAARLRNYDKFDIVTGHRDNGKGTPICYNVMGRAFYSYTEAINYLRGWLKERHNWVYEAYIGEELPPSK